MIYNQYWVILMGIGANIKKRRLELGLSQQELADLMGYKTRSTIAKIESECNDITQKKIYRFSEVLNIPYEKLISESFFVQTIQNYPVNENINKTNKIISVILAGGKSIRNNQNIPNQFITILNKPVIVYCLEAYEKHPLIDEIYVVCLKGWESIINTYSIQYNIHKLKKIIPAGNTGIISIKNSVDYLQEHCQNKDIIIYQESTRPMISQEMISNLISACNDKGCATICNPMKDHVQFINSNNNAKYLDRNSVVDLQSPDAYNYGLLSDIFKKAKERNHILTESCLSLLLYNLGYSINFIEGASNNIKIIHQEDISMIKSLLLQQQIDLSK